MNGTMVKFASVIALIIIAFFGYRFFFAATPATPTGLVGLSPAGMAASGSASSDEFLTLLLSLKAINLDDLPRVNALLSGLQDFSTTLQPQTPGRPNPFAPLGDDQVASSTKSNSAATTTATSTKK